jgi:hypothetical protein
MRMLQIYGLIQLGLLSFAGAPALARTPSSAGPHLPFSFVENSGQASPAVRYIGSGPEFKAWFEDRGVILQQGQTTVRVSFEGSGTPQVAAEHPIGARANYLRGNDPRHWQTDLPLFAAIRYLGLWPGSS